jgi:hypothetical protein
MQKVQGFVENGNLVITVGGVPAAQKAQGSYPQAQVAVYLAGTLTLATIYADNAATPTPKANPFTAQTNGYFYFYAANGRYDVTFSGGGLAAPLTFGDILLADPSAGPTNVNSVTEGPGINVTPTTGNVVVTNEWGSVPVGVPPQYVRLKPNAGNNTTFELADPPYLVSTTYNFPSQSPGSSLTAGANVITLTPVPLGINGSNSGHYLYISGGTGTAEAVRITGGTAVSGAASGTIIFNCVNTHAGAWTIQSATVGIQEAIYSTVNANTVFIPDGTYTIHGPVTLPVSSCVTGSSMYGVYLNVASDFPLSVTGVFIGPAVAGNGPALSEFSIFFIQPDSANLATYTQWPPAFSMVNTGRFEMRRIAINRAWDGVRMTGNAGGSILTEIEISHFHFGIEIDGALDSVYLTRVRFWPYNLTGNQITAFQSDPVVGLSAARGDDLQLNGFFATCGTGIHFFNAGSGGVAGLGVNVMLDSLSSLIFDEGQFLFDNLVISLANHGKSAIVMGTGVTGMLTLNNCDFIGGAAIGTAQPLISMASGYLQINNSRFETAALNVTSIAASSGALLISDSLFRRTGNVAYTVPTINITGSARASIVGNRTVDKGSGTGTFISIATGGFHQVRANEFIGWSASYPADRGSGVYEDGTTMQYPVVFASASYNLVTPETGANNAIAGSLPMPVNVGLCVTVILSHTLQAGPNTFNLNGIGALPIKKHTDLLDLTTGYVANGMITLTTDLVRWLDMSQ